MRTRSWLALGFSVGWLLPLPARAQPEIPDNGVDEDGNGWLGTSAGFELRAAHPRVVISQDALATAIDRMSGPGARDPYARWFDLLKSSEDGGTDVSLTALALLYRATGDATYRDRFLARLPASGTPGLDELYGVDLLFDELPVATLTAIMQRAGAEADGFYYNSLAQSQLTDYSSVGWGYHAAFGAAPALAYAGVFALTTAELGKDPIACPFDAWNYVRLAAYQLSEAGYFYQIERRIAGDPTANDALPGSPGGMYDNFGYDTGEESYSINLLAAFVTLTGSSVHEEFLHDRYRASFFQNMQYPYLVSSWDEDAWCRRAGTEAHQQAKIWNTQTDWITQPRADAVALTASLYQDARMQHYANQGTQFELCGAPYDGLELNLLYYDDALPEDPPSSNPTAAYFNGPGLVSTRSDWTNDAAFAVLIAGEGISRRYEDANSFLLGRKGHVVTHAGARIRNNPDNDRHHWYAIRAASKNTLKIYDPDECFDVEPDGSIGPLHSGTPLVASDNMGGMIFETNLSAEDGCYPTWSGGCASDEMRASDAYPLGVTEHANVIKFEHVESEYTYAVGDGTAAYTRKLDFFERELVELRPEELFLVFDRVQVADPTFRKVWVIHTVDEPLLEGEPVATGQGMRAYDDGRSVLLSNARSEASLSLVYPRANRVVVRGGDTALARAPLSAGAAIEQAAVTESEIPRWVELLASGSDADGSLTIEGDAEEGAGMSETIAFSSDARQEAADGVPDEVTATTLTDSSQQWIADEWAGYMVQIQCGGESQIATITANTATSLSGTFTACSAWRYAIFRYLANSTLHFQRITRITTSDLDFDELVVSIPHYFDAEDVTGRLHSFSPHTDGADDGYRKRTDLGQWTLEVEATEPNALESFLNLFALGDPGAPRPAVTGVEGPAVVGAEIDDRLVTFAREREPLESFSLEVTRSEALRALLFDLVPATAYGCERSGATVSCARDGAGATGTSSAMGVLRLDLPAVAPFDGGAGGAGGGSIDPGAAAGSADDDGGCGCRMASTRPSASALGAMGLGLLFLGRRATRLGRKRRP